MPKLLSNKSSAASSHRSNPARNGAPGANDMDVASPSKRFPTGPYLESVRALNMLAMRLGTGALVRIRSGRTKSTEQKCGPWALTCFRRI